MMNYTTALETAQFLGGLSSKCGIVFRRFAELYLAKGRRRIVPHFHFVPENYSFEGLGGFMPFAIILSVTPIYTFCGAGMGYREIAMFRKQFDRHGRQSGPWLSHAMRRELNLAFIFFPEAGITMLMEKATRIIRITKPTSRIVEQLR
jgi:hypothetical protein